MNVGKTCGMAVIVVAIIPVILGMVWPDGTETVDVWNVEPGIDVTGDLSNREIPVWDTYTGPLNNLSFYDYNTNRVIFPAARDTTNVPNSYPVSSIESSSFETSVTIEDLATSGKARFILTAPGNGLTITDDSGTYHFGDYWPATNTLVLYRNTATETVPAKTMTPKMTDVISGSLTINTYAAPTEYVNAAEGLISPSTPGFWNNGMQNSYVDIWVRMLHTPSARFYVDMLQITWDANDGIKITDDSTTAVLGSVYEYISVRLYGDGKSTVTGLIGVDSFLDRSYTEGNSIEFLSSGHLDSIPMLGTYSDWWVESTVTAIRTAKGIKDSDLAPSDYFGVNSWQFQIINPSVFGDSLVFTKNGTPTAYPIDSGAITVTNLVTGEQSTEALRGMRVLSLIEGGAQNIYINGIKAIQYPASGGVTVTFSGPWMASIVTAKVVQTQQERYTWDTASFGFDQTAFCTVGMLSCALVGIVGSFWGKRTWESVAALYLVMGVCAAAYIIMIP